MRGLPSGASELRSRQRFLLSPGRHRCVKFHRLSVTVRREVRHTLCGGEKKSFGPPGAEQTERFMAYRQGVAPMGRVAAAGATRRLTTPGPFHRRLPVHYMARRTPPAFDALAMSRECLTWPFCFLAIMCYVAASLRESSEQLDVCAPVPCA